MSQSLIFALAGFLLGIILLVLTLLLKNRKERKRIEALSEYLEQIPLGRAPLLSSFGEDSFSKLEDAVYKTATYLYQTRDAALQDKKAFKESLSNIAHQLKTPITAISLSLQTWNEDLSSSEAPQDREKLLRIQGQIARLTRLEESLLLMSRLDSGSLSFQKREADVFTLLVLAADNLQELSSAADCPIHIPELGEMALTVDPDWTMEALMNLMKNSIEHNKGGAVHCSYGQNPLYTEILIWDEGEGFAQEDIPCLFQRFYRGKNANSEGIGLGLALAKEIIEAQNGTIRARNLPEGGALFEIHFYRSH